MLLCPGLPSSSFLPELAISLPVPLTVFLGWDAGQEMQLFNNMGARAPSSALVKVKSGRLGGRYVTTVGDTPHRGLS